MPARGRFQSRRPLTPAAILLVVILLVAYRQLQTGSLDPRDDRSGSTTSPPPREAHPPALAEGEYPVRRVVDGDTLLLENHIRVRLIGVDTPETKKENMPVQRYGPEATRFTEDFIRGGRVRLTFDRERLDQYGRYLAYVWMGERLLNEELLRAGLARYESHFHYSSAMKSRFRNAVNEARDAGRGIWSQSPGRDQAPQPRHGEAA